MTAMTIGSRVQSLTGSSEFGTVLDVKTEHNGIETETAYLITWDLDDECDEPGWNWAPFLTPVAA